MRAKIPSTGKELVHPGGPQPASQSQEIRLTEELCYCTKYNRAGNIFNLPLPRGQGGFRNKQIFWEAEMKDEVG